MGTDSSSVYCITTQLEHDVSRLMSCSDYAPPCTSPPNVTGKSGIHVADVAWYGAGSTHTRTPPTGSTSPINTVGLAGEPRTEKTLPSPTRSTSHMSSPPAGSASHTSSPPDGCVSHTSSSPTSSTSHMGASQVT